MLARHHLGGCKIHRIEPRSAKPVDLHAGHVVPETRYKRSRARDVAARFADRIDATEHDVVDELGVELVTVLDGRKRLRGEIERRHLVQRAVGFTAPARRADGVVNECIGHGALHYLPRVRGFARSAAS